MTGCQVRAGLSRYSLHSRAEIDFHVVIGTDVSSAGARRQHRWASRRI
jgi:hypothetical protein